jgi:phage-related protein
LLQSIVDGITTFITDQVPVIQETLQFWVDPFLSWIDTAVASLRVTLGAIILAIAAWATSSEAQTRLTELGNGLGDAIATGIGNSFENAPKIAVILGKLALALLAGVGVIAGTLIIVGGQIVAGIVEGILQSLGIDVEAATFNKLSGILGSIGSNILEVAKTVGTAIIDGFKNGIGEGTATLTNEINNLATIVVNAAKSELQGLIADPLKSEIVEIQAAMKEIDAAIITKLMEIDEGAREATVAIITGVIESITGKVAEVQTAMKEIDAAIIDTITEVISDIKQVGADIIAGLSDGISDSISTLTSALDEVSSTIITTVQSALGISSPSSVFFSIGSDVVQGLINGILGNIGGVASAVGSLLGGLLGGGGEEEGGGISFDFSGLLESLKTGIPEAINTFKETFNLALTTITELLGAVLPLWIELFTTNFAALLEMSSVFWAAIMTELSTSTASISVALSAFWAAILLEWTTSLDLLQNKWKTSWDAIQNILEIASPVIIQLGDDTAQGVFDAFNNVDWKSLGRAIGKGIEDGLRSKKNAIVRLAKEIAKAALRAAKRELGVSSPSTEFFKLGVDMMRGLEAGVRGSKEGPLGAIREVANNTTNEFNLTINTSANPEPIIQDFEFMQAAVARV